LKVLKEVSKMSDELEIYEANKYRRKGDELDFSEDEKGGAIITLSHLEYPEPGRITEPKEVKSPVVETYHTSIGVLETESIVPKEIRHAKKIGLLFLTLL